MNLEAEWHGLFTLGWVLGLILVIWLAIWVLDRL